MLVFVSMCPGDLASASVLAAIARPPYIITPMGAKQGGGGGWGGLNPPEF